MQTYVINTSENRVFDSNFLFELVGYNNITWMYSGLERIDECAKTIIERQSAPMADECRIVVLVDFYSFPHTLHPDLEAASDYIAIYKSLIEIYLLDHLFDLMRGAHIAVGGREVFYIQYIEQATHRVNAAEQEHLAYLLSLSDEEARLRRKNSAEEAPKKLSTVSDEEYARILEEEKNAGKATKKKEKKDADKRYTSFDVSYEGGILSFPAVSFYRNEKEDIPEEATEDEALGITFNNFYRGFLNRRAQPFKYGIRTRTYIATGTAPSRAAFDTLALSLSLIRIYENEENVPMSEGNETIPNIDKDSFTSIMKDSYNKVNAALEKSRLSSNRYYCLEWPVGVDVNANEIEEEAQKEKIDPAEERRNALSGVKIPEFEERYQAIRSLATRVPGKKSPKDQQELDKLMAEYKAKRDQKRDSITKDEDKLQILKRAKRSSVCPFDLDYKNALAQHEGKLRKLLKSALEAEYVSTEYDEELKEANRVYDKYKAAEACMTKNVIGDGLFLFLTLAVMLIPFMILQSADLLLAKISMGIAIGIAAGVFGGLFALSFFLHILPYVRKMNNAKAKMTKIYEDCLVKQYRSFAKLQRRYNKELLAIEDIRYNMRVINFLHHTNYEQNRHASEHREMLERVRDALLGMMSSLRIIPDAKSDVSIEGEFNIEKPFNSNENRVYKVFSVEAIEKMFNKKGGR